MVKVAHRTRMLASPGYRRVPLRMLSFFGETNINPYIEQTIFHKRELFKSSVTRQIHFFTQ